MTTGGRVLIDLALFARARLETGFIMAQVCANLFGYPQPVEESHRHVVGQSASLAAVENLLVRHPWLREPLGSSAPF